MYSSGRPKLVIAIDFGTTYSGLIYMVAERNSQETHLDTWPGAKGKLSKVPTVVSYIKARDNSGNWAPHAFGFAARAAPEHTKCSMFKMCFEDHDEDSDDDDEPQGASSNANNWETWKGLEKRIEDVVGDFLQLLYLHMISVFEIQGLESRYYDYHILFTVPAQFTARDVGKFSKIIGGTGFGEHNIKVCLKEPEAAALYTLQNTPQSRLRPGECVVLCDAGGGTVDIASYKVMESAPLRLEQANIVSGKPCGSCFIDQAFKRFLLNECLTEEWRSKLVKPGQLANLRRMCDAFSSRKETFGDQADTPNISIQVSPPQLEGKFIKDGYVMISRKRMRDFFAQSVEGTLECLKEHVEKCIKSRLRVGGIFLVGGLGSSPYLYTRVREYVSTLSTPITVTQPKDAEFAVIRGAIRHHYRSILNISEDPITTRLCPVSYGIRVNEPWDDQKHNLSIDPYYTDKVTNTMMAARQVDWLIKKGDRMTSERLEFIKDFERWFAEAPEVWKEQVVMCTLDFPPNRLTNDVHPVCVLQSDMTGVPMDMFEKHKKLIESRWKWYKKSKFYRCNYQVAVRIGGTDMQFFMLFQGKQRNEYLKVDWTQPPRSSPVPTAAPDSNRDFPRVAII